MSIRQKISTFLFSFLLLSPLFATEIEDLIKSGPSHDEYPQAGAIILLDRTVMKVNKDKTTTTERYLVVKIFEDRGKKRYGDVKQRYDKESGKVEIEIAKTHRANGEIVEPVEKAYSDVSAPEVWDASAYTNAMMKVVSFPALEKNAVIEYKCKVIPKKKKGEEHFWGKIVFAEEEPVLKKEFSLILPKEIDFHYTVVNGEIEPTILTKEDNIVYTWTLTDIPQVITEPNMPPIESISPKLLFTSFPSWEEAGNWLTKKFYKELKLNKELQSKIKSLTEGKTHDEKIRDIFLWVNNEFRNIRLGLGLAGYEPNKPSDIFKNRYGDCRDKALLLIACLEEVGIPAYPMLVNRSGVDIIGEIPSLDQFDHMIVAIPNGYGFSYLDPQSETSRYGYFPPVYQSEMGFMFGKNIEGRLKRVTPYPIKENLSLTTMEIFLEEDGSIKGKLTTNLDGFYDKRARERLKNKTKKELDKFFERNINTIQTGTKLISYELTDPKDLTVPISVNVEFETPKYGSIQGKLMRVSIPNNPYDFSSMEGYTTLKTRNYDLVTSSGRTLIYRVKLKLPSGYTTQYLPENFLMENSTITAKIECEKEGNEIIYNSTLILKKKRISVSEYDEFKKIFDEYSKPKMREIILMKS